MVNSKTVLFNNTKNLYNTGAFNRKRKNSGSNWGGASARWGGASAPRASRLGCPRCCHCHVLLCWGIDWLCGIYLLPTKSLCQILFDLRCGITWFGGERDLTKWQVSNLFLSQVFFPKITMQHTFLWKAGGEGGGVVPRNINSPLSNLDLRLLKIACSGGVQRESYSTNQEGMLFHEPGFIRCQIGFGLRSLSVCCRYPRSRQARLISSWDTFFLFILCRAISDHTQWVTHTHTQT